MGTWSNPEVRYQFSNLQYIITDRENTSIEKTKYKEYYRSVIYFISLIKSKIRTDKWV